MLGSTWHPHVFMCVGWLVFYEGGGLLTCCVLRAVANGVGAARGRVIAHAH